MKLFQILSAFFLAGTLPCLAQPTIFSQPQNQTNIVGDQAAFGSDLTYTATDPYTVQWKHNGANMSGQTDDYITFDSVAVTDAGTYTVKITDSTGKSVTSSNAVLTVWVPPTIQTQPTDKAVVLGNNVSFTMSYITFGNLAPLPPSLSYQWFQDGSPLVDSNGVPNGISGSTSPNLTIRNVSSVIDGSQFNVIVSNPATADPVIGIGNDTRNISAYATLTVLVPPIVVSFDAQPSSSVVVVGDDPSFSVTINDDATDTDQYPLTYQWRKNGLAIPGETDSILADYLIDVAPSDEGNYSVDIQNAGGIAHSPTQHLTVLVPPLIITQPQDQVVKTNVNVTFTTKATGTAPLYYQWLFNGSPILGATGSSYTLLAISTAQSGAYSVIVSNAEVALNPDDLEISDDAILTVKAEIIRPTVAITFPPDGSKTSNAVLAVHGTANDNVEVKQVFWAVNQFQYYELANGTANWSANVPLVAGTNIFYVYSVDSSGNTSLLYATPSRALKRRFFYSVLKQFALATNGIGGVTPSLGGKLLEIGKDYTITAKPGVGQVFRNWSGGINSTNPVLTFMMQNNLALQANFIPNPFIPRKGTYSGLFYRTNGIEHETSGFFTLTLTDKGAYSCKLQTAGANYSGAGIFNLDGLARTIIPLKNLSSLVLSLKMDLTNLTDQVLGTITDGHWIATLIGDRAIFNATTNPAPQAGNYTLAFVHQTDDSTTPGGDGFSNVTVDRSGKLAIKGTLADGAAVSQNTAVSKNGQWPFYINLYSGHGSSLGWLMFTNRGTSSIEGDISWIKTAAAHGKNYTNGFDTELAAAGSHYTKLPPGVRGVRILDITNGEVILSGGNLNPLLTNTFLLGSNNTVTVDVATNNLKLTLATSSGSVSGSFIHPTNHLATAIKGIILQEQNVARGFFLTPTQSGGMILQSK